MGIDKSNVRWVIHYNLPKNIEGYYQEIGRGGRDGLPAHALLFYSFADVAQLRRFISQSENADVEYAKLERMQQFAEALSCRRIALLNYFGEHVTKGCGNCDICTSPPAYFDATVLAQKVCSAVARLGEREPMGMVIDVLRGAQNAQVLEKGYQQVKTYGAVKEVSWLDLQQYVIQLLNQGVLEINFREGARLGLTPLAKEVLFSKKPIQLAVLQKGNEKKAVVKSKTQKTDLFEKLRLLRQEIATEQGVPAYVVFGDASLKDMEAKLPKNETEFMEVSGVGQAKLEKYAALFLKEIAKYSKTPKKSKRATHDQTFDLFSDGLTITEIAETRGLSENTIYGHLMKKHAEGEELDLNQFVSSVEIAKIEEAKLALTAANGLKDFFEYFEEQVPYWKIKLGLYLLDA